MQSGINHKHRQPGGIMLTTWKMLSTFPEISQSFSDLGSSSVTHMQAARLLYGIMDKDEVL